MTTQLKFKFVLGFLFSIILGTSAFSQEKHIYQELSNFSNFSFYVGNEFYTQAKFTPDSDEASYREKINTLFNPQIGFLYTLYPDRMWSFQTGIMVGIERTFLKHEMNTDIPEETVTAETSIYNKCHLSIPLILNMNLKLGKKVFANLNAGLKMTYLPLDDGHFYYGNSEEEKDFELVYTAPENPIQGSFITGIGLSFPLKKVILKANVTYSINFQSNMVGQYIDFTSDTPSTSEFKYSGNHFGLTFAIGFKKCKAKI